jgi:hypothetical protein
MLTKLLREKERERKREGEGERGEGGREGGNLEAIPR